MPSKTTSNKNRTSTSLSKKILRAIIAALSVAALIQIPTGSLYTSWLLGLRGFGSYLIMIPIILFCFYECYQLGVINSQSPKLGKWAGLSIILFVFFYLFYLGRYLYSALLALKLPWFIIEALSLNNILIYSLTIFILELISDTILQTHRLIISTLVITGIVIFFDIVTLLLVGTSQDNIVVFLSKMIFYGPLIWGFVVFEVNKR